MLTREEALDTMGATLDDWIDKKNMHMLIDKIYDNFEEAIKPKSCDGCKYGKFGADSRGIEVECTLIWHCARGNGYPDRYEPKEIV